MRSELLRAIFFRSSVYSAVLKMEELVAES